MSSNSPDADQTRPIVVRTLKPPPEIWELVQPVEIQPSTPLLSRLRSSGASFILFALVVGLAVGVGAAFWQFRNDQKPSANETTHPVQVGPTSGTHDSTTPTIIAADPIDTSETQPADVNVSESSSRPTARPNKPKTNIASRLQSAIASSEITMQGSRLPGAQAPKTDQRSGTTTEASKNAADSASTRPKSNATLNSLVIPPAKPSPTPKAKVIQWP